MYSAMAISPRIFTSSCSVYFIAKAVSVLPERHCPRSISLHIINAANITREIAQNDHFLVLRGLVFLAWASIAYDESFFSLSLVKYPAGLSAILETWKTIVSFPCILTYLSFFKAIHHRES